MTVIADDSSDTSDEDLELLLLDTFLPPERKIGCHLNANDVSEDDFENLFRFPKSDFERLVNALNLPQYYICDQRTVCPGADALLILLRRLAYPNTWCELVHFFGREEPELSMIFNQILSDLHGRFRYLLDNLDLVWLDPATFAEVIHAKGAPLTQCWGFIDGTAKAICRPIRNQRIILAISVFIVKFQSVIAPNGMICHLFGPLEGRRHDAFMLVESNLVPKLQQKMNNPNGDPYVLYGDPAYPIMRHILAPFRGAHLTPAEESFNKDMSDVRVSVEWGYGKIANDFAFMDFNKNLKVLLQPVGKLYITAALLANCHTSLYGSQTAQYFDLEPTDLETYLNNQ